MEEKEIIKGNRLIAEFTGWVFDSPYPKTHVGRFNFGDGLVNRWRVDDVEFKRIMIAFSFHSDWNKLMPVVEKIEGLSDDIVVKIYTSISGKGFSLWNYFDSNAVLRSDSKTKNPFSKKHSGKTKIEAVWLGVVDFIQWHNTQQR